MTDDHTRTSLVPTNAPLPPHAFVSFHPGRNGGGGGNRLDGDAVTANLMLNSSTQHRLLIGESTDVHFTLVYNADAKTYTLSTGNAVDSLAEIIVFTSDVQVVVTSTIDALRIERENPPALALRLVGDSVRWVGLDDTYEKHHLEKSYNTLIPKPHQDGRGVVILLTPYQIDLQAEVPALGR